MRENYYEINRTGPECSGLKVQSKLGLRIGASISPKGANVRQRSQAGALGGERATSTWWYRIAICLVLRPAAGLSTICLTALLSS